MNYEAELRFKANKVRQNLKRIGGLDPAFVKAARDALRIVAGDPEGEAFLEKWYALEEAYRQPLW